MRYGIVFKGADDVSDRVHLAKVAEIAGFFEGILADCAEVNIFNRGVSQFFRIVLSGQPVEAIVGNLGDSDMSIARVRGSRYVRLGENPK